MTTNKIVNQPGEKWAVIRGRRSAYGEKYAISNHGRLVKFTNDIKKGLLVKGSLQAGYPIWRYKENGEHRHVLIHLLVAKYFLPAPGGTKKVVTHLNFNKKDNHYKNLKWVSFAESAALQQKSPIVIKARKEMMKNGGFSTNSKLTVAKVQTIKKMLAKGDTLKKIATKFKVSDMQIHRIKIGENWGKVK